MASDFHSHRRKSAARTLVSGTDPDGLASFQAHPWDAAEPLTTVDLAAFAAIGETGLDKVKGPASDIQIRRFEEMLELAKRENKSVVIHCVRAWAELLEIRKRFPTQNWLIHGFRGSPELAEQLRKQGFFLSLGMAGIEKLLKKGFSLERIGFETDDEDRPIEEILQTAAAKLGLHVSEVEYITDRNFEEFLCLNVSREPFC
ncbi:MAG: TatD family hydrolase [Lentisphaeria bacterium]|nr:TatD family hydrolase [Lentisphaeria bacterium]